MGVQNRLKFQPIKAQLCQVHYLQDIYPSWYLIRVSSIFCFGSTFSLPKISFGSLPRTGLGSNWGSGWVEGGWAWGLDARVDRMWKPGTRRLSGWSPRPSLYDVARVGGGHGVGVVGGRGEAGVQGGRHRGGEWTGRGQVTYFRIIQLVLKISLVSVYY